MKREKGARSRDKTRSKAEVLKVSAGNLEEFRRRLGPGAIDQALRQALQLCWMLQPDSSKTVDALEKEFRRMVDRALQNFREDQERFAGPP